MISHFGRLAFLPAQIYFGRDEDSPPGRRSSATRKLLNFFISRNALKLVSEFGIIKIGKTQFNICAGVNSNVSLKNGSKIAQKRKFRKYLGNGCTFDDLLLRGCSNRENDRVTKFSLLVFIPGLGLTWKFIIEQIGHQKFGWDKELVERTLKSIPPTKILLGIIVPYFGAGLFSG